MNQLLKNDSTSSNFNSKILTDTCFDCPYKNYDIYRPHFLTVIDSNASYVLTKHGIQCLRAGTQNIIWKKSPNVTENYKYNLPEGVSEGYKCVCQSGWYGLACSYPYILKHSFVPFLNKVKLRDKPRRIIQAITVNMEFDWLETTLEELDDIVDVFLILESSFTNYGDKKPLLLLKKLKQGFLSTFQHKIIYIFLDEFPSDGRVYGDKADNLPRVILGQRGLREHIKGLKQDDLFILTDADELLTKDSVLFLKMHDNFPEPIGYNLQHRIFGFFWKNPHALETIIVGVCSIKMMAEVFSYRADHLRASKTYLTDVNPAVMAYVEDGGNIDLWMIGQGTYFGGYHCSWCLHPKDIRTKLLSAQSGDNPRWGDYTEKTEIKYIEHLIETGDWFSDKPLLIESKLDIELPPPQYMMRNYERFKYLLENPYRKVH